MKELQVILLLVVIGSVLMTDVIGREVRGAAEWLGHELQTGQSPAKR